ncbi:MAG: Na/Pi symporter [Bryobacterales bacterium]|nr:Na/Pi symporter [Acidobacteriota bacterium]MCB9384412.1 Na/Pi symporter [Bryobacterales bacterium]
MISNSPIHTKERTVVAASESHDRNPLLTGGIVIVLLFLFLLGVHGLGDGFKLLGRDLLDAFFRATSNPIVALMVGLLATTLVQSSSVTTSMIVGLVAAPENPLPVATAIPMIMGSNIGTTVTNTIVSLAHIGRKDEFRRAFSVATCHDFFNYMTVLLLLPLELATGYLQKTATWLAGSLGESSGVSYDSPLKGLLKVGSEPMHWIAHTLFANNEQLQGVVISVLSACLVFFALLMLVKTLRSLMQRKAERLVESTLGGSGYLAILIGMVATMIVQSSSITTSLLVPLAGAGLITLQQAFPVTLGANIGTTVTALLASLAVSGPNAAAGVTIALVHALFNLTGTAIVYPFKPIRQLPLMAAEKLADVATYSRAWAIGYVVILFYALPAAVAFIHEMAVQ